MAMELPGDKPRNLILVLNCDGHRFTMETGGVLPEKPVAEKLGSLLAKRTIFCHDMKTLFHFFDMNGVGMPVDLFDTMLAEYLLDPSRDRYMLRDLAVRHLGREGETHDRILEDARRQVITPKQLTEAAEHAADVLPAIGRVQKSLLEANGQTSLLETVEMPLALVLGEMERDGFRVDPAMLVEYGNALQIRIPGSWRRRSMRMRANPSTFFPRSSWASSCSRSSRYRRQRRQRPAIPRMRTCWNPFTHPHDPHHQPASGVQAAHEAEIHLCRRPAEGNIAGDRPGAFQLQSDDSSDWAHQQHGTEPPDIPIRTEAGRLIRKAFLPKPGFVFVDADYSQIELRVLGACDRG